MEPNTTPTPISTPAPTPTPVSAPTITTPVAPEPVASSKIKPLTVILITSFFLAGWLLSFALDPYVPFYISNSKKGYKAGYDSARKFVEQSPVGKMFTTEDVVHTISGVVFSKDSNAITIHAGSMDPFGDPSLNDRVITVSSSTTVVKLVPKDPRVFQSEIYSYFNSTSSPKGSQPQPFTKVPGTLADIEIGSPVAVTAAENIKNSKSFPAQEIDIQYQVKTNLETASSTGTTTKK